MKDPKELRRKLEEALQQSKRDQDQKEADLGYVTRRIHKAVLDVEAFDHVRIAGHGSLVVEYGSIVYHLTIKEHESGT